MKARGTVCLRSSPRASSVFSPRDTRNTSDNRPSAEAHAQIGRVHNRNSRATTGPTPYRPAVAPQRRYEHKVKSRSNKAT